MSYEGCRVAFQAANGQYVCAERGGGHEVVANRDKVGPWETFQMQPTEHSSTQFGGGLNYTGGVFLRAANGQYLCAEKGGGREPELVANRDRPDDWERFLLLIDHTELNHLINSWDYLWQADRDAYLQNETPLIHDGQSVALHTWHMGAEWVSDPSQRQQINSYFVCAERGGGHEVMVNRNYHDLPDHTWNYGPWETFTLRVLTPQSEIYGPRETEPFRPPPAHPPRAGGG